MADVFTKEKRSWIMSRIRSKDTKVENSLAKKLRESCIPFKRYPKILGNPDFIVGKKTLIFVDGCFWHGCPRHYIEPKSKKKFWIKKIKNNISRDTKVRKELRKMGYKVIRLWEHQIENSVMRCIKRVDKSYKQNG